MVAISQDPIERLEALGPGWVIERYPPTSIARECRSAIRHFIRSVGGKTSDVLGAPVYSARIRISRTLDNAIEGIGWSLDKAVDAAIAEFNAREQPQSSSANEAFRKARMKAIQFVRSKKEPDADRIAF